MLKLSTLTGFVKSCYFLVLTNKTALFQRSIVTLFQNLFMISTPDFPLPKTIE